MMTHARFAEMLGAVPANARKVYEAVPIDQCWTFAEIGQEVRRLGYNMNTTTVMGCVITLKDAGIVHEPHPNQFCRMPHKPKPVLQEEPEPMANNTQHVPILTRPASVDQTEKLSAFDKLSALSTQLRTLATAANSIADDLDDVALAVEERLHGEGEEMKKLRLLRDAIKGLA